MDPVGQGSFIPKQSLTAVDRGGGVGLFLLLSIIIFLMSLIAAGAAFGYQQVLNRTIADKDADLKLREGEFNSGTIQDLLRIDRRITQTRALLQKHVAPSAILYFLSTITLKRVQLNSFDATINKDGGATLGLSGVADSFSSVALQSDQFGATKVLKDVVVSGVSVNEKGKVSFSVNATVDPTLILYKNNLVQSAAQSASSTQTTQ